MIKKIEIENGEYWWGGTTIHAYCPIGRESEYHQDFIAYAGNQTMPMFISTKGRILWSENPFKVDVSDGIIEIDGDDITLENGGSNLKEAYLYAQKKYFPCDGEKLEKLFFTVPQYNTWIQFAYYSTQEGVLKYAHGIIDNGFEPGIFIIDEGWHGHTDYGHWEFDFARFPDPKAMVKELHSLGFTVMLWIAPFVTPVGPHYFRSLNPLVGTDPESAKHIYKRNEKGDVAITHFWDGHCAILDFTSRYDCKFLDDQLQHLMDDYGVDGFKFDGGATDQYSDGHVINGNYAKGATPAESNAAWNDFGRKYKFHEFKDTFKGGGKNTIERLHDRDHTWTGNGINELIPCAINAGLIGHPFICPDMIGGGEWRNRYTPGFETDQELFVRMAQCSALFPMMQFSWAPWEALDKEHSEMCLEAAKLHKKFSGKILALVEESEKSGEPVIRSLEYNFPHEGYEEITDEFMLGEEILVAPVVTKGTFSRKVCFPEGKWQDADGNVYEGKTDLILPSPVDRLLYFEKVSK